MTIPMDLPELPPNHSWTFKRDADGIITFTAYDDTPGNMAYARYRVDPDFIKYVCDPRKAVTMVLEDLKAQLENRK